MIKQRKKLVIIISIVCVFAILGAFMLSSMSINAAYIKDRSDTSSLYSAAGILVVQETLHASGYSTASTGSVEDKYLLVDRCWFPNNIQDEKTWSTKYPTGEYARGSYKNIVGIPSPWGAFGMSQATQFLEVTF